MPHRPFGTRRPADRVAQSDESGTGRSPARISEFSRCRLCPRDCGADRTAGERGVCGAGTELTVYRYGPHHGEEPPISGERGSGTVFFSHCNLRCLYCQNYPWSQEGRGRTYTVGQLMQILRVLREQGCHNWNLVTPTPWWPLVREALRGLKEAGVSLPVVYNTSGYERGDVLADIAEWTDVFLVDLRYSRERSGRDGSGAGDYVRTARAAIRDMWARTGPLKLAPDGTAVSGTVCRVLILPGLAGEAIESLEWLAREAGTGIAVSVMAQYVPAYKARRQPPWDRGITREEYDRVREAVRELGFEQGWVQDIEKEIPPGLVGFRMSRDGNSGAGPSRDGVDA